MLESVEQSGPSWVRWLSRTSHALAFVALITLGMEYGTYSSPISVDILHAIQAVAVASYVLINGVNVIVAKRKLEALRQRWFDIALIVLTAIALVVAYRQMRVSLMKASAIYIGTFQVLLLVRAAAAAVRFDLAWSRRRLAPARIMALGFTTVILVGGTLLWALPKATSPEIAHQTGFHFAKHVLNCYFTATSATCVTGLVVYDTGKDFTLFGQIVILVMIQVGGLGIMMFGSFFGLLTRRQLSLRQSLVLQDALTHRAVGEVRRMVWFIVIGTVLIEAAGAAILYPSWPDSIGGTGRRIYYSVFHAISAFCNAGFALHVDNLAPYRHSWGVYTSVMPLIVLGGLGFPVLVDLFDYARSIVLRTWRRLSADVPRTWTTDENVHETLADRLERRRWYRLSVHTKSVLATSAILIVGGAALMLVLESVDWRRDQQKNELRARVAAGGVVPGMVDLPFSERCLAAVFQSVTTRTAGFNTVAIDPNAMSPAGHFVMCLLMFIGGSPASTAGGIKTVTMFVIVMAVYSTLRGRDNVEAFNRTIPLIVLRRASVVLICMFALVSVCTLVLCVTERASLLETMFEVISASATVGLSTGLTPRLTVAGKIIIMLAMFIGRIGPLTVLVAVAGAGMHAKFEYPQEQVAIG